MSLYNNVWLLNSIKLVSKGTCNLKEWLADCRDKRTPVPYSADSLRHN